MRVAADLGVGLAPGVGTGARPDALLVGGEALDLLFEGVEEGEAVVLCWKREGLLAGTLGSGERGIAGLE